MGGRTRGVGRMQGRARSWNVKIRAEVNQDEALFFIHHRDFTDDGGTGRLGRRGSSPRLSRAKMVTSS